MHRLHKHDLAKPNDGKCCVLQANRAWCRRKAIQFDSDGFGYCCELDHFCDIVWITYCACGACGPELDGLHFGARRALFVIDKQSPNYIFPHYGCRSNPEHNARMRNKKAEANPCAKCGEVRYGKGFASVRTRWDYYQATQHFLGPVPTPRTKENEEWCAKSDKLYESSNLCLSCWNKVRPFVSSYYEAKEIKTQIGRIKRAILKNENRDKRQPARVPVQSAGESGRIGYRPECDSRASQSC